MLNMVLEKENEMGKRLQPGTAGTVTFKGGATFRITRLVRAAQDDMSNTGFCVRCGAEHGGCEPDARNYKCEECGAMSVFGAEELAMRVASRI